MKTKPHWCPTAVATNQGWVNPTTGELLVSLGGLAQKLEDEAKISAPPVVARPQPVPVIKEAKIKKPKKGQQVIAEVVEYDIDQEIIGE